jgi:hypothetical protein
MSYGWSIGSEKRPRGVGWSSSPHHLDLGILDEAVSIEFRAKKGAQHSDHIWRYGSPKWWENVKWGVMDQVHAVD